ncbi:hypothetical protein ACFPC0_15315 [Streptomyces andamanensis]|uniref:Uncharacterized protein n=2 Tax=Streptomyces TaxID=1883 RepID=A0ABV8TFC3_9ACTN
MVAGNYKAAIWRSSFKAAKDRNLVAPATWGQGVDMAVAGAAEDHNDGSCSG